MHEFVVRNNANWFLSAFRLTMSKLFFVLSMVFYCFTAAAQPLVTVDATTNSYKTFNGTIMLGASGADATLNWRDASYKINDTFGLTENGKVVVFITTSNDNYTLYTSGSGNVAIGQPCSANACIPIKNAVSVSLLSYINSFNGGKGICCTIRNVFHPTCCSVPPDLFVTYYGIPIGFNAYTANQKSVANSINPLLASATSDSLANAINNLSAVSSSDQTAALNRIGAPIYAASLGVSLRNDQMVGSMISARMSAAARGGSSDLGSDTAQVARSPSGLSVWAAALGNASHAGASGNTGLSSQMGGAVFGADQLLPNGETLLGVAGSFVDGAINAPSTSARDNHGAASLTFYARRSHEGLFIDGQAGLTAQEDIVSRSPGLGSGNATDNVMSYGAFVSAELGFDTEIYGVAIEPAFGLRNERINRGATTETGSALYLGVAGTSASSTQSSLGVRASVPFTLANVDLTASSHLAWTHEFNNGVLSSSETINGIPSSAFTVASPKIGQEAAVGSMGLKGKIAQDLDVFGDLGVEVRRNYSAQNVSAGLRKSF